MSVVIHAGLKKCGSTSVHEFLSSNRNLLQTVWIDYPGPGRPGTDLAHEIKGAKAFGSSLRTLSQLAESHAQRPEWTMLISSEMLESAETEEIACIRTAFAGAERPVAFTIILIIRGLIGLLPSVYAQQVRTGKFIRTFDEFFQKLTNEPRLHFFQTASKWAEIFGWSNLKIRVLDRDALLNNDLIDDFLSVLGCQPSRMESLPLERPGLSNVAPGWKVIEALRALRQGAHNLPPEHSLVRLISETGQLRGLGRAAARIGDRHAWNGDRGRYLTRQQAETCLHIYDANIKALTQYLSPPLSPSPNLDAMQFQEREYMPQAAHIPADQLRAFYDDLAAAFSRSSEKSRTL